MSYEERMVMEYSEFYNGVKVPMLGFGVYQIPEYKDAKKAVLTALKTGYRLIDTAQGYIIAVKGLFTAPYL